MAEIEVKGLDEFAKALNETTLNLTQKRKLLAKGLRKASEPILEAQKDRAPDDLMTDGSRIEDNLGINVIDQTGTSAESRIGSKKWGFVGRFAELGTSNQSATPWMGPAYDATIDESVAIFGEVLGKGIEDSYK
jgi:HK97 gp10 family phage protein